MDYIGIRCDAHNMDFRRELLLFDRLVFPNLEAQISQWSDPYAGTELLQQVAELEWLSERGIAIGWEFTTPDPGPALEDYNRYWALVEEASGIAANLSRFGKPDKSTMKSLVEAASAFEAETGETGVIERMLRLSQQSFEHLSRYVAIEITERGDSIAVPVIRGADNNTLTTGLSRTNALNIAFNAIPFPSHDTPLEKLLDFRSDPLIRADYLELHKWAKETAIDGKKPSEILEEVEYLIAQYKRHMDIHKLECDTGFFETVFTVGPEFLEDLVKIKWGDAAKLLFSFRKRNVGLLKAESNAPGKQLAYLVKASEQLS